MNWFGWTITILGFIATIVGSILALATYISPMFRLKYYLKKTSEWKKVSIGRSDYVWQYKNHPEFNIEIEDLEREWQTAESWMTHYPDPAKHVYLVKVKANGQVLLTEEFITLDGGRYFVPVPKAKPISESEFKYWYTPIQVDLSRIIGEYYRGNSIEEFMEHHKLKIKDND